MARTKPETMEVKIGKHKVVATVIGEENGQIRVELPSGSSFLVDKPEVKAETSTKKEETRPPSEEAAK